MRSHPAAAVVSPPTTIAPVVCRPSGGGGGETASGATGNALVEFDPAVTDAGAILAAIDRGLPPAPEGEPGPRRAPPAAGPRVQRSAPGRVRIAVRGIDRDPQMARQVVDRLRDRRG